MKTWLGWIWSRLDANYWFYPAIFVLGACLLSGATLWLDYAGYGEVIEQAGPPLAATPESARTMLQIISGGMLAAAVTVFSITIAAVVYASGTYGPRLLTNFLDDRGNQLSLATLIGTFVHALIVLGNVRMGDSADTGFVPQISLIGSYLLVVVCVGVIVFLLNHIPSSIRINHVLEGIGRQLLEQLGRQYPDRDDGAEPQPNESGRRLPTKRTGYVQLIDFDGLERLAHERDCTLALHVRPGDFVHSGMPLARQCSGSEFDDLAALVEDHFTFGAVRTPEQDLHFLFDELVEIGLRALSPGINDPFTAITALHWLGAATADIGCRKLGVRPVSATADGDAPLVVPLPDDFAHFSKRGFGAIRGAVATSPIAALVMLDVLASACLAIASPSRRAVLQQEADDLLALARTVLSGPDLQRVEAQHERARSAMTGLQAA